MGQNTIWHTIWPSASQEILCILCNLRIQCFVHNNTPAVPIVSQIKPINSLPSYFKTEFNNNPSMCSRQPFSLMFSNQKLVQIYFLPHPQHATFYNPLILFNMVNQINIMRYIYMCGYTHVAFFPHAVQQISLLSARLTAQRTLSLLSNLQPPILDPKIACYELCARVNLVGQDRTGWRNENQIKGAASRS
jgi:hypothetical protein